MKYSFLLASTAFFFTLTVNAERVALVIGNNQYSELPERMQLSSPVADAMDVATALSGLGYTIVTGAAVTDASRDVITSATEKFAQAARNAEAAVFYYSGHGVQVGEDNYILPTDTPKLTGISMLKGRGVLLRDSVMVALEEAGAKTKIIILDCCRDNPFSAQLESALSGIGKSVKTKSVGEITGYGPGFYLAFATSPGTTAEDGNGARNSPFTAAMLKVFPTCATKDIDFFFRDVKSNLGLEQVSWTNHSLTNSFTLASSIQPVAMPSSILVPSAPGASELEKLQREIAELKRLQLQMAEAPPQAPSTPSAADAPPAPLKPLDLPESGFFERSDLFAPSPYADYNSYSQMFILKQVQEKLKKLGHYTGATDGARGPGTQKALNAWQHEHGLPVSGRLDISTLEKLDLAKIKEMSRPTPPMQKKAVSKPKEMPTPPPAPKSIPAVDDFFKDV
ncbi:putative caspase-like protein [Prosthecobacter fusiformis]|uniref:Putative caspase-like protein n=1 Tax=Prosthecobacter fusiformis TaxID=48464 RepID=A0A4R7RPE0_9BACT|nr:caspase family protein [Prosthecobacter fusiformis]TDU67302.1 putative caspase-like protein [Prosthecobacter fusiformis]